MERPSFWVNLGTAVLDTHCPDMPWVHPTGRGLSIEVAIGPEQSGEAYMSRWTNDGEPSWLGLLHVPLTLLCPKAKHSRLRARTDATNKTMYTSKK